MFKNLIQKMGIFSKDEDTKNQEMHVTLASNDQIQTAILITLLVLKLIEFLLYFSRSLKKTVGPRNGGQV